MSEEREALGLSTLAGGEPSTDDAPTVLLHGFTQTARCWEPVAQELARTPVLAVDLPGHGRSSAIEADLWRSAHLVADAIATGAGGPATVVGYSLGARVALHVALAHPEVVSALVLVSGTAGIDDDAERAARRRADERLAERLESIGVARFVDEWLELPLFAGIPLGRTCRSARLTNTTRGLASSLRLCGTGTQEPLWDRLDELAGVPVLVVSGADDPKFTALGDRLAARLGDAAHRVVLHGCGHTPPLEQPEVLARLVGSSWDDLR